MNAIDTNVLVYRLDRNDLTKQAKARMLLRQLRRSQTPTVLPWQVLTELGRYLCRLETLGKIRRTTQYSTAIRNRYPVAIPTVAVLDTALDLSGRYSLSHWDSMILGACKEAGVTTLYTEDMGAPTSYDGIQPLNPFI
jgi:predicted nucleic acid-binding protein